MSKENIHVFCQEGIHTNSTGNMIRKLLEYYH